MPRRKKEVDFIEQLLFFLFLGIAALIYKHKDQVLFYGTIALVVLTIFGLIFLYYRRKHIRKKRADYIDEDKLLYYFRGMPPKEFEKEVADIYSGLGYKTEHIGKSHDGGIDVMAKKDGDQYYIQCKKYITSKAGVNDVRALHGVVAAKQGKKGIFISTNGFTTEVMQEFKGNPRIELVDEFELIKLYQASRSNN